MNYLVITPFLPLPGHWWGGYVYDQIEAIRKTHKFDNIYILRTMPINKTFDYEIGGGELKVTGLPFFEMPSKIMNGNGLQRKINEYFLKKTLKKKRINLREIQFIHLHTNSVAQLAPILKKESKAKLFLQHHDLNPYSILYGKFYKNKINLYLRLKNTINHYSLIDCHICISEACRDNLLMFPSPRPNELYDKYKEVLKLCTGFKPSIKQTYILYNGVNENLFPQKLNNTFNPTIFNIGCIGTFTELKNYFTLIKSIETLNKDKDNGYRLRIIGDGPLGTEIRDYINKNNLEKYIKFEKSLDHDKLYKFYHNIDLFCLPSYFEGFGCVFTEAYSCGIPFITCRYQGMEEFLNEEDKKKLMITNPYDYNKLAHLIEQFKQKPYFPKLQKEYRIQLLINNFTDWIIKRYK